MKGLPIFILPLLTLISSCAGSLNRVRESGIIPQVSHSKVNTNEKYGVKTENDSIYKSVVYTNEKGREFVINETVKDEESGEVMNMRELNEVCVIARSRNVSERGGVIPLGFIVKVPEYIIKSDLQLTLTPSVSGISLEPIILSGSEFKKSQIRGYRRYEQYLKSIIPDNADTLEVFTYLNDLTIFLERHLPQSMLLSGAGNDTLKTLTGVREREILTHYIKEWLIERNNRKKSSKDEVFEKLVKNPFQKNARLDSVIKGSNSDFYYHYTQDFHVKERLKKLHLNLKVLIRDRYGSSLILPSADTLTYYISSLLNFADTTLKYKKVIKERKVSEDFDIRVVFRAGSYEIIEDLGVNSVEIEKFRSFTERISENRDLTPDSLSITSFSSPEGPYHMNEKLSRLRGLAVNNYLHKYYDSTYYGSGLRFSKINFRYIAEDWTTLASYIINCDSLKFKEEIIKKLAIDDPDRRELEISKFREDYEHLKRGVYPDLRRVSYRFYLSRNDMEKDTIHTTVVDSLYMNGKELLLNREYTKALLILRDYADINSVVAMISLGMEKSAEELLRTLKESDKTLYLRSILKSRAGEEQEAVELFLRAVGINPTIYYRGLLDPEISTIIRRYNLDYKE